MRLYECSMLHEYRRSTETKLSTPPAYASGGRPSSIGIAVFFCEFVEPGSSTRDPVQLSPGLGHRAPNWIRVLALEVVDDPSADVRAIALAKWVLEQDES